MKKFILVIMTVLFLTANVAMAVVNINTADKNTLTSLPGVGEVKAEAIIQYRHDHPFKSINDLQNVKGIGPKIYKKLSKEITTK